ncbi:Sec-independent protein translocase protein TatB [Phenylobacterium sp.]|uniref:Sec-independent protein translocase protein TatB n=1 Tax=Phenylobacterium sp. TaxID=1871053 RepID=UPI0025F2595A|nr:Sec-independent protein translocase protein TatB [Phenylobacterium sp.]
MFPEGRFLEFLIVGIVALVVVGPKDLPVLLRRLGQFTAKLRGMAAEFRASFDEMARQSELDELRKEVEAMRHGQIADMAAQSGHAEMQSTVSEIEQHLSDVGVQLHPPMSYQYTEMQALTPAAETAVTPPKPARKPRAVKPKAAPQAATAAPAPAKAKATPRKPAAAKVVVKAAPKPAAPTRRPRAKKPAEAGS